MVAAHGQVHKREHVELRHDGEAQEYAVQEKAPAPELLVQLPLVQVNAKHLQHTQPGQRAPEEAAPGGEGGKWGVEEGEGPPVADFARHRLSVSTLRAHRSRFGRSEHQNQEGKSEL